MVTDVRLAFDRSAGATPLYSIQERILESQFRRYPDTVTYIARKTGTDAEQTKRQVIPDDFVLIVDEKRLAQGGPDKIRALLEIDMRSRNNPALEDKLAAYAAYLGSPQYEARFGTKSGRWFFVTTGEQRMTNLMNQTERIASSRAKYFSFSLFDLVLTKNVLTEDIWWQPGVGGPFNLESIQ
jgi:hypothetical protein